MAPHLPGTDEELEVEVKTAGPMRVAWFTVAVPAYGEAVGRVFAEHLPDYWAALVDRGLELGPGVAEYEEPKGTDDILVHLGYEIGAQAFAHINGVHVVELPAVEVASTLHRGSMSESGPVYEALVRWVDTAGYRMDGWPREIYHQWGIPDEAAQVTEIQLPICR